MSLLTVTTYYMYYSRYIQPVACKSENLSLFAQNGIYGSYCGSDRLSGLNVLLFLSGEWIV